LLSGAVGLLGLVLSVKGESGKRLGSINKAQRSQTAAGVFCRCRTLVGPVGLVCCHSHGGLSASQLRRRKSIRRASMCSVAAAACPVTKRLARWRYQLAGRTNSAWRCQNWTRTDPGEIKKATRALTRRTISPLSVARCNRSA